MNTTPSQTIEKLRTLPDIKQAAENCRFHLRVGTDDDGENLSILNSDYAWLNPETLVAIYYETVEENVKKWHTAHEGQILSTTLDHFKPDGSVAAHHGLIVHVGAISPLASSDGVAKLLITFEKVVRRTAN